MTIIHVAYTYCAWVVLFVSAIVAQYYVFANRLRRVKDAYEMQISAIHTGYDCQGKMLADELKLLREQNDQVNEIALFLRKNYKQEIDLGYHNRPFALIINGYLKRERECQKKATKRERECQKQNRH